MLKGNIFVVHYRKQKSCVLFFASILKTSLALNFTQVETA